jgi:hypothetical protein
MIEGSLITFGIMVSYVSLSCNTSHLTRRTNSSSGSILPYFGLQGHPHSGECLLHSKLYWQWL